jgi:pimeloyl-ACP methyl ester carboxylesterase
MADIAYRTADVDGLTVLYREAGASDAPTLVLLHGFPSASHMFRELIPLLADRFHLVAPDLPGFGKSDMPARGDFDYTFEQLTDVIERLTEVLGLDRFALYVFDYGAPIGFRLATRHPERITAIISQNGNAYTEGLSDGWNLSRPGRTPWKPTGKRSGCSWSRRPRSGSTRTVSPIPHRSVRTATGSTTITLLAAAR